MNTPPKRHQRRARSSARISDEEIRRLADDALFVIDDFIDVQLARDAREEVDELSSSMRPAGLGRGAGHRHEARVRGDRATWLDPTEATPTLSALHTAFTELREELNRSAYLGLDFFEVQLAHYPGGGAGYERHVDAFRGSVNRRVTAIVYLNENWKPEHGGQLRAWLPRDRIVELAPITGRLVCFLSEAVPHQVLPAFADRYAVTAWYRPRTAAIQ